MNRVKYNRDIKTGAVILSDSKVINDFNEKRKIQYEMESLKEEINTLKQQVRTLNDTIGKLLKSE